jgi:hypothetical protein
MVVSVVVVGFGLSKYIYDGYADARQSLQPAETKQQ